MNRWAVATVLVRGDRRHVRPLHLGWSINQKDFNSIQEAENNAAQLVLAIKTTRGWTEKGKKKSRSYKASPYIVVVAGVGV